jgi:hypothetical protein
MQSPGAAGALRRHHGKGIVKRFVGKPQCCRSLARFELSDAAWFVRVCWI